MNVIIQISDYQHVFVHWNRYMWFSKKNKEHNDMNRIEFDPETQYAVIRSSICTGEKVAGFKNKKDGHFVEVMVIRSPEDERRFKEEYNLDSVRTEY